MYAAVFDIGGVLRKVALSGANKTNFIAMRVLYRTLVAAENWEVIVVTSKPADVDEAMTLAELDALHLPRPDKLVVVRGHDKREAYERFMPSIVFDDNPDCIEQAIVYGAAGALIQ
jgi:hypothetical protein